MSVLDSLKDDDGDKGSVTQRSQTATSSAVKKPTPEVHLDLEPVRSNNRIKREKNEAPITIDLIVCKFAMKRNC